jgi:subtilisin family serine protease
MKSKIFNSLFTFSLAVFLSVLVSCSEENELIIPINEDLVALNQIQTTPIPNQYIVVFEEDRLNFRLTDQYEADQEFMRKEVSSFFRKHNLDETAVQRVYSNAIFGFVAKIDSAKLESIRMDPAVKYIEQDRKGMLGKPDGNPPFKSEPEPTPSTQITPWGISRVKGPVSYRGHNAVFVIDTGIDLDHPDLNVNSQKGFDAYHDKKKDWNMDDEHGHGTHVAGTIGAKDNSFGVVGVAAGVPVVPVKVFYGPWAEFTYSGLIAGIEHVGVRGIPGDVANLSFGGFDESNALDEAVLRVSTKRRVWMVIASGNSRLPGNSFSPARVNGPYTITVSAIDSQDSFAWFSHYGFPIKYAAPGVAVISSWLGGGYWGLSGTSMAAPHVSGIRILGEIGADGFAQNYPIAPADPIAVISGN